MVKSVRKIIKKKKCDRDFWEFVMIIRDTKTGKHSAFHFYEPKGTTVKEIREKLHSKDKTKIIINVEKFSPGKKDKIKKRITTLDERYAERNN